MRYKIYTLIASKRKYCPKNCAPGTLKTTTSNRCPLQKNEMKNKRTRTNTYRNTHESPIGRSTVDWHCLWICIVFSFSFCLMSSVIGITFRAHNIRTTTLLACYHLYIRTHFRNIQLIAHDKWTLIAQSRSRDRFLHIHIERRRGSGHNLRQTINILSRNRIICESSQPFDGNDLVIST